MLSPSRFVLESLFSLDLPLKKYDNVLQQRFRNKGANACNPYGAYNSAGFFDPKDALSAIIVAGIN